MTDFTLTQLPASLAAHRVDPLFNAYFRISGPTMPLVATGTHDIMILPAGLKVLEVRYRIVVPQGATLTFDVGDAASATRFFSNANGNAAAGTRASIVPATEGTPNVIGFDYTAQGVLRVTADNAWNVAVVDFWVRGFYDQGDRV